MGEEEKELMPLMLLQQGGERKQGEREKNCLARRL